jgi:hypothetical protein
MIPELLFGTRLKRQSDAARQVRRVRPDPDAREIAVVGGADREHRSGEKQCY